MAERDNERCDPKHHYVVEKELAARLWAAPTRAERKRLYGAIYDERIRRIPSHPLARRAASRDAQRRAVNRQLRLLSPFLTSETHFLDVGSGDCALALAVARRVARVYAVDVSRALSPASVPPPNYTFILSDGISVPVSSGSIDVALSNQVLEHLHPDDVRKIISRDSTGPPARRPLHLYHAEPSDRPVGYLPPLRQIADGFACVNTP